MVQPCPEVGMYLEMPPGELAKQVPRDMKGVAKRLFCDAYMYLYQSPRMCLYRWGGGIRKPFTLLIIALVDKKCFPVWLFLLYNG